MHSAISSIFRGVADAAANSLTCLHSNGGLAFGLPPPDGLALSARRTGGNVLLFWPAAAQGFDLYSSAQVSGGVWIKAQVIPIDIGGQIIVTLPTTNTQQYYRLMKP